MKKINSQKGFVAPLIIIVVLVIAGVVAYKAVNKTPEVDPMMNGAVTILSPNGRETLTVGVSRQIAYSIATSTTPNHRVLITLEPGMLPIGITEAGYRSVSIRIPENILVGGDALAPIQPGQYKLRVSLYDGQPCVGLCPVDATSTGKLIGYDETDGEITVKLGEKVLDGTNATSTATTSPVQNATSTN